MPRPWDDWGDDVGDGEPEEDDVIQVGE